jgi:S1-C subfamily serine protease
MSESNEWAFPEALQPKPSELNFDLDPLLDAVVSLRAEIAQQAFSANTLGTSRAGSGVVLDDRGTVLTIGYLITEAETVFLTTRSGQVVQAVPLAYDQATGFGLLKALRPLNARGVRRGSSRTAQAGDAVYLISQGGLPHALSGRLADKRPFAGYWEYLLEAALFTTPVHPQWSGSGLFNADGELIGIGSLLVQDAQESESEGSASAQGNMFVPIDILEPILDSLIATGHSGLPSRPWLGLYAGELDDQVVVGGLAEKGPAKQAGVQQGDLVLDVAGTRVHSLATFLRAVWDLGPAGVAVPLTLGREGELIRLRIQSVDRSDMLYRPTAH